MVVLDEATKHMTGEQKALFFTKLTLARAKKRMILFVQQNELCHYCQRKTHLPKQGVQGQNHGLLATLDHIIPACRGGGEHLSNFVVACRQCNSKRNHMDYQEYYLLRSTPGAWAAFEKQRELDRKARKLAVKTARKEREMARGGKLTLADLPMEKLVPIAMAPRSGPEKHEWDMLLIKYVGHNGINLLHNWLNDAKWNPKQGDN